MPDRLGHRAPRRATQRRRKAAASGSSLPVPGAPRRLRGGGDFSVAGLRRAGRSGMDSLLSIVQMPAGVPVGTLAIGRAGAVNAALLAAAVLALTNPVIAEIRGWHCILGRRRTPDLLHGSPPPVGACVGGGQRGRVAASRRSSRHRCRVYSPRAGAPAHSRHRGNPSQTMTTRPPAAPLVGLLPPYGTRTPAAAAHVRKDDGPGGTLAIWGPGARESLHRRRRRARVPSTGVGDGPGRPARPRPR